VPELIFILLTNLYSKKKTASPSPVFPKIFHFVTKSVFSGKGLPHFFFPYSGCLQDEKEMIYSKAEK
jgi:hypothetical protein